MVYKERKRGQRKLLVLPPPAAAAAAGGGALASAMERNKIKVNSMILQSF